MNSEKQKILIIDDEIEMLRTCEKMLTLFGYNVVSTTSALEGLELIKNENFNLLMFDLLMPEMDGLSLLKKVKEFKSNIPVIILSAYGTIDRAVACMKAGALDFVQKPFEADHLKLVIEKGLNFNRIISERDNLLKQLEAKYKFENIIGRSNAMLKIFEVIESISESEANILITGESGTGKELIARSIHARSKRKTNPFVAVNCGAFPESLFEAEVFGYEKGAFTNAYNRKLGLMEYANSGTFFLDEVCELPYSLQTKLLRVLQDKETRRLGGNELIEIDVRWISATNRDVEDYLKKELLREDFYYRLNVINIHIPPLRERREDIALLAKFFLEKDLKSSSKNIKGFSPNVIASLENYNWPGNVRELENAIERAVAFAKNEYIEMDDLPKAFQNTSKPQYSFGEENLQQLKQKAVSEVERSYLKFLLSKHNGNVSKISAEAGMTRRNTYFLLNKYSLNPQKWR